MGLWQTQQLCTCKRLALFRRHNPEMPQVSLVSDEHDDNVVVRVFSEFLQPAHDVLVGEMFGDVIDQKSTNCAAVIPETDVNPDKGWQIFDYFNFSLRILYVQHELYTTII